MKRAQNERSGIDSAEHALFECKAYEQQHDKLKSTLNGGVTYGKIIMALAEGKEKSEAITIFNEEVMKEKEEKKNRARQHRKRRRLKAKKVKRQERK